MHAGVALLVASIAFVAYAYAGYPVLLGLLAILRERRWSRGPIEPTVSLILAVHNEEQRIREKLENTLLQDYPRDRLEILVASDGSTDGTDAIVREFQGRGIRLVRTPGREGKEGAQKRAVDASTGEILAFSDAATILPPDAIRTIVMNFRDPEVGCVSSVDRVLTDEPGGEGAYVRYEMLLRRLESRVGSVVGLSGSFFAARREVCEPWRTDLPSDFNTLVNAVGHGRRGISDDESIAYYRPVADSTREYGRKVRTVLRGITVLMSHPALLNPFRHGLFSWQLLSHKLFRWLVPYAVLLALASNIALAVSSRTWLVPLVLQGLFYLAAICGMSRRSIFRSAIFAIPAFFVEVQGSILQAWYYFLRGRRILAWSPSIRNPVRPPSK
jgi:glycosyltransferase involved in cell wall biosynthesis